MRIPEGGRGFSVTELLVALAVIGVLATIAVPRFQAQRVRGRQAEAKTQLALLARGERVYFADQSTYTDDLRLVGVSVSGAPRYLYGFTTDMLPAPSANNDTAELKASGNGEDYATAHMVDGFGVLLAESDLPPAAVSRTTFTLGAVGNADGDPALDRWTLGHDGTLRNVTDDAADELSR